MHTDLEDTWPMAWSQGGRKQKTNPEHSKTMVQFSKQHPTVSQTPAAAVKTGRDNSGENWLGSSHGREAVNVCAFAFIKLATKQFKSVHCHDTHTHTLSYGKMCLSTLV